MKRILFAALALISLSAGAQTADEVIQKYSAAIGGAEAYTKVNNAVMKGTLSTQGMDLPFSLIVINGRAMRTDVDVMGKQIVSAYKDGKGWKVNPYAGAETKTEVTGSELIDYKTQSSLLNPLMTYAKDGNTVELKGSVSVEGINCFEIDLHFKADGKVTKYFISQSDYTLIKSSSNKTIQGEEMEVETFYSDFKDINGLKFAMDRVQKINGQVFQEVKLTTVDLNTTIDEKIFDNP
ncbi:MAG: hypothetical protein IPP93_19040 [Chitinophagaceae bacterium]|nr:hypothetical protein [Chitinophagaceae bacterium]MBL0333808.1 hypothetical protein [Chitinophagaceae bacterium]